MYSNERITCNFIPSWSSYYPYGRLKIDNSNKTIYALGHLIRQTESTVLDLFAKGIISGTTHTCIGQEICEIGVIRALWHEDDMIFSNHRNHGHVIAFSGKVKELLAEIMGKESGLCRGRGGSQHISFECFHSHGIQGGLSGIGVGVGLAKSLRNTGGISAIFLGDGTTGMGLLYESLNLASIWNVPVLFIIENNGIAQTTATASTIGGSLEARGKAFGLSTWHLRDDDEEFISSVESIVEHIRSSRTPGFLVIDTHRLGPHSKGDDSRTKVEIEELWSKDLLNTYKQSLDADIVKNLEEENNRFIKQALETVLKEPDASVNKESKRIIKSAQSSDKHRLSISPYDGKRVRVALNETLRALLSEDENVLLLGEDITDPYGGAFKITKGLSTEFPSRVISTPISEAGFTGAAIGLALSGYKPIVEIMFADFLTLCIDQIYNHAVKFSELFEHVQVPIVIRTPAGGYRGYGPTHSQSPENLFVAIPGLAVVFGSHRHNLGDLLRKSVQDCLCPVLFFEHKLLYTQVMNKGGYVEIESGDIESSEHLFPTLIKKVPNPDITFITYGGGLLEVEKAARILEHEEEMSVEIIVPSLLSPLPIKTILSSGLSAPILIIVEETHQSFGIGAEISAQLYENGYTGKVIRIGASNEPIPSARTLEMNVLPTAKAILKRIRKHFVPY